RLPIPTRRSATRSPAPSNDAAQWPANRFAPKANGGLSGEKGPAARRRPRATREASSLLGECGGPFWAPADDQIVGAVASRATWHGGRGRQRSRWALIAAQAWRASRSAHRA